MNSWSLLKLCVLIFLCLFYNNKNSARQIIIYVKVPAGSYNIYKQCMDIGNKVILLAYTRGIFSKYFYGKKLDQ